MNEEPIATVFDENAFGIWLSWFDAEEEEYAYSAEQFAPRIAEFRLRVFDFLKQSPPSSRSAAFDMGTACYVEFGDGDQCEDPIRWIRALRDHMANWRTFAVVAHGGRWIGGEHESMSIGTTRILSWSGPSEPFRKVMAAEAQSHDDDPVVGWGVGLFVDVEALEALSRKLRNKPTLMSCAGASFVRISG